MAMFLALLAVAVVAVLVVLYRARVRAPGGRSTRRGGGQLAQRVAQARAAESAARDTYVDDQAAVWESSLPRSGRPVLFEEDLGRPDPRTPEAYDVSGLYASTEVSGSVEDAVEDLASADFAWEATDHDDEGDADRAFAADLDEVDDDPELDRFAPRRAPTETQSAVQEDEFASELLGSVEIGGAEGAGTPLLAEGSAEPLERRTPKAAADAYRQPLRLARTQQRPTGAGRRSPEQMRAMLLNYRGGMKKGRENPHDSSVTDES